MILLKSIGYRCYSTLITFSISFFFTQKLCMSINISVAEIIITFFCEKTHDFSHGMNRTINIFVKC